jgi:hypothetical protein
MLISQKVDKKDKREKRERDVPTTVLEYWIFSAV